MRPACMRLPQKDSPPIGTCTFHRLPCLEIYSFPWRMTLERNRQLLSLARFDAGASAMCLQKLCWGLIEDCKMFNMNFASRSYRLRTFWQQSCDEKHINTKVPATKLRR